jgi:hypothetical protein
MGGFHYKVSIGKGKPDENGRSWHDVEVQRGKVQVKCRVQFALVNKETPYSLDICTDFVSERIVQALEYLGPKKLRTAIEEARK